LLGRVGWGDSKEVFSATLNYLQRHESDTDNMLSISPHSTLSLWRGLLKIKKSTCKGDIAINNGC